MNTYLSETGTDMSKFASDKHFASWLGLCPGTQITGGKLLRGKTKRCANRAAQALRLAAAAPGRLHEENLVGRVVCNRSKFTQEMGSGHLIGSYLSTIVPFSCDWSGFMQSPWPRP